MRGKKWLIFLASLAVVLIASSVGITSSSFVDLESSSGNSFQAWTSTKWVQTTQADFEAGVLTSTVDVQVEADADDGEEDGREYGTNAWKTDGYYGDKDGYFGYYETYDSPFEPAFRFDNITCSGTVTNAYLKLYFTGGGTSTTGGYLYAIDEADPVTFSESDNTTWPSNRNITTAKVSWNQGSAAGWVQSPDIKTLIQELVDSYTYTGTQAMALYWREDTHTQGTYTMFELYGHPDGHPPTLHIEYTTVDTATSPGDVKLATTSNWYDTNWSYRKQISIDYTKVDADLADFPVLISLSSDPDLVAHAQSDGDDILFTSSDGTKLSHEIEEFDDSIGKLVAWVKVPSLSSSTDTDIYMYYGNPTCASQQNVTGAWDTNFKAVWHLKEDPSGTAPQMIDSTSNNNDGTSYGSMTSDDQVTGQVNGSLDLDGSDDYLTVGTTGFNPSAGTVEVWVDIDSVPGGPDYTEYPFCHVSPSPTSNRVYIFTHYDTETSTLDWGTGMGDTYLLDLGSALDLDTWYHLAVTWDGTYARGYKNGVLDFGPTAYSNLTTVYDIWIGSWRDGASEWFDGIIDEVRISDTARSAEWIKTCYNNQNSPSSFYSVGSEQGMYVSPGSIASQVLDTGVAGARWDALFWDETVPSGTDITFEVRASDALFAKDAATPSWISVGGTSPVTSGLPSGRYMQWRATLITSDTSKTPTLYEVRVYHY